MSNAKIISEMCVSASLWPLLFSCSPFQLDASELVGCSQCVCVSVCVHILSSVSVCTVCLLLYFSLLICMCVYIHSTEMFPVCGCMPTAAQRWKIRIISLPAGLHVVSRVQTVKVNINLKPNKNNTGHHATASPLCLATKLSCTPFKCQLDQRKTLKKKKAVRV